MILLHRIIPFLSALTVIILWEIAFTYPEHYLIFFAVILGVVFVSIAQMFHWNIFSRHFIGFFTIPMLLSLSVGTFLLFLEDTWLKQFVVILHIMSIGLFLESCFAYVHDPKGYQPYALQNVTGYINLLTLWCLLSSSYAAILFFQFSAWIIVFPTMLFVGVVLLTTFWMHKITLRKNILFFLINLLLFVQLFLALHYLPISWIVNGLVLVGVYYIVLNMSRYHLLQSLNRIVLRRYVFFGLTMILGVLMTARWL